MALTKITNDLLDLGSDTGALGLPKGTTAQRPSNPVEGTLRHNSEIDETKLETYNGIEWRKINSGSGAAGGSSYYNVEYLIVAGGAGGGVKYSSGGAGGGGGAGGIINGNHNFVVDDSFQITVGAGGSGATYTGALNQHGAPGENSSIVSSGILNAVSIGGGSGGGVDGSKRALDGGSGGGAGTYGGSPGGLPGGDGTPGQGSDGGASTGSGSYSGGGGGAGGPGSSGLNSGGSGVSNSILGVSNTYSVGGSGNNAGSSPTINSLSGTGNGGQGSGSSTSGKSGGSGVAILRMPTANYSGTTTGSPTVTTDGTDTILTYTSSGTYTA